MYNDDERFVIIKTMQIESMLKQFGLSTNEAKIYLASLALGQASAQEIATKARIKRTTAYSVLSALLGRGIVGKTKKNNKTRFVADSPERLLTLTSELQQQIKAALPELQALTNRGGSKPRVIFFEGAEAIQQVYDDTLTEKPNEILEWNTNDYFTAFPVGHGYIEKRQALGIRARRIAGEGTAWQRKHKSRDSQELAETIIVPSKMFSPNVEVNIYGHKIAFMSYADQMSIIIESKAIAEAMRQAYELSWKGAKQYDEENSEVREN